MYKIQKTKYQSQYLLQMSSVIHIKTSTPSMIGTSNKIYFKISFLHTLHPPLAVAVSPLSSDLKVCKIENRISENSISLYSTETPPSSQLNSWSIYKRFSLIMYQNYSLEYLHLPRHLNGLVAFLVSSSPMNSLHFDLVILFYPSSSNLHIKPYIK